MAERIDLTNPIVRPIVSYSIAYLGFDWRNKRIAVEMIGDDGSPFNHTYEGPIAETLMIQINKANNSTKSMQRRVIEKLIADGFLSGSISGVPD